MKSTNQPIINNAKASPYFREGIKAFKEDLDRNTNPYEPMTYKFTEWDRGWFKSFMKGRPIGQVLLTKLIYSTR